MQPQGLGYPRRRANARLNRLPLKLHSGFWVRTIWAKDSEFGILGDPRWFSRFRAMGLRWKFHPWKNPGSQEKGGEEASYPGSVPWGDFPKFTVGGYPWNHWLQSPGRKGHRTGFFGENTPGGGDKRTSPPLSFFFRVRVPPDVRDC